MRFGVRLGFILVFALLSVLLIGLLAHESAKKSYSKNPGISRNDEENEGNIDDDQAAQLLLASDPQNGEIQRAKLTVSVAIVMVVSLLAVALLITGIIVVAVTIDPRVPSNENSDVEEEEEEDGYGEQSHLIQYSMF
ncbi:unnamed protein product, partial [Mesorhabditis belari]|uniref:Uncharacterized protein n=1 Tax=Mesorhabditis belari TaxID=2138241 RepID=A0AAF3EN90_9BILA